MAEDFHRILPCAFAANAPNAADRGWRLRLSREDGELAELVEEQVLPERVMRVDANRVNANARLHFTTDEARWLLEQLTVLVPIMEKQDAEDQAKVDARKERQRG